MAPLLLNGFGRIGRSMLRAQLAQPSVWPDVTIAGINDLMSVEMAAYLFKYDSVFGPYPGEVSHEDAALIIDGQRYPYSRCADVSALDFAACALFVECTGRVTTRAVAEQAIAAGAPKVLISGPCTDADVAVVLGANDSVLAGNPLIVSNASCTTNAVAPLMAILDSAYQIQSGMMTTVHCYTGSQPSVDKPTQEMIRSRAAALSIVPTTTSAEKLVDLVLPKLAGRVIGSAVRVPVASVSAVDLTVMTTAQPQVDEVTALFLREAQDNPVFGAEGLPVVSTDLRQRPESIIMSLIETKRSSSGLLRVFGWYDNEWGFSNRMLDVASRMV